MVYLIIIIIIIIKIAIFIIAAWPIIGDFLMNSLAFYVIRTPNSRIPKVLKWIRDKFFIILRNMKLIVSIFFSILGVIIIILLIFNINSMYRTLSSEIPLLLDYILSKSCLDIPKYGPGYKLITSLVDLYMDNNSDVDSTDGNANYPNSTGDSPSDNRSYVYPSPDRNNPPYVYPSPFQADPNSEATQSSSQESVQDNNNSESVRARTRTSSNNTTVNRGNVQTRTDNANIDPRLSGNVTDASLTSRVNPVGTAYTDPRYNPNNPSEIDSSNNLNVGRNARVYLDRQLRWQNNSPYTSYSSYFVPANCNGYDWSKPSWADHNFKLPREEAISQGYSPYTSMSQQPYARDLSKILYDASHYRGDIFNKLSFRDQIYAERILRSYTNETGRTISYSSTEFIHYLWNLP
jgi:hypothetical protein